ncbi:hypothetical protein GCK72_014474 [Caenorhabditis remanei]|uniref:Sdz-33 F-box domain-containing protein n=1 Tax=Caenorhabditis remanei TaxID=31234 RepID=A0A6A5GTU1_CAERE|nr:hypothetical protein GCK72_014474 [Caenorhabditis remanei]KAF1758016.1 hypothetical protein GCK72_014474 [Caenorhabditis remanei]
MDYLWMRGGSSNTWISLDNIMDFDCIHIDLASFSFTSYDMNRYLKAWINGCNARMEYLFLGLRSLDHNVLTDGMHAEENDASTVRIYSHQRLEIPCVFEGGTNIRRKDGRLATFQQIIGDVGSVQRFPFKMVVWPEGF